MQTFTFFLEYYKCDTLATRDDAKTKCKQLGTYLPSIHSAEENEIVRQVAVLTGAWIWIGLYTPNKDGNFVAWGDGTQVNYTNWDKNTQLLNKGLGSCVLINHAGYWVRYFCIYINGCGCILKY
jgi:hypothetical protein